MQRTAKPPLILRVRSLAAIPAAARAAAGPRP
jgi:hypothetical protein